MVNLYIENQERFKAGITRAKEVVSDLRVPLTLIAKDFYRSEQAIFKLQSKGLYTDLADSTKKQKMRLTGQVYPILKLSGALERSVTEPTDPNAINEIINKDTLVIGTRLKSKRGFPYPRAHHTGTSKMPQRGFLFIGPESRYANDAQLGRPGRWLNILNEYVLKHLGAPGAPVKGPTE